MDFNPHLKQLENKRVFRAEVLFDLSNTTNLKENMVHHETEYDAI